MREAMDTRLLIRYTDGEGMQHEQTITIALHPVQEITQVWVDGQPIEDFEIIQRASSISNVRGRTICPGFTL